MTSRIAIDTSVIASNRAGSHIYTSRLVDGLRPLLGDRLIELMSPLAAPPKGPKRLRDRFRTLGQDVWWAQWELERRARAAGAAMLHAPANTGPVRGRLPLVATIYDATVLRFPDRFPPWFRTYARAVMPRVAARADAVLTLSEASKRDLVEMLGIDDGKVTVTHVGIPPNAHVGETEVAEARRRLELPERFVLTVGSIEPRKNLPRLIEALHVLRRRPATADVMLLHVGPSGWLATEVAAAIARFGLADRVRFMGYLSTEDLAATYSAATLTAYPSLYEGFGLPVLEAMARGSAVVTSNVSSMPEVAGGAAALVDPSSVEEIAEAIARLWVDEAHRAALVDAGRRRASEFTVSRMARETVAVYDRVAR